MEMKQIIIIIILISSLKAFAQFDYIEQTGLYIELGIKEINAYDNASRLKINDERWLLDEKGHIFSHKLLETEDDSTFSLKLYFFENDQLAKSFDIGIWNTSTNKLDTGITTYFLNKRGQPIRSTYTNTRNTEKITTIFDYEDERLLRKVFFDSYNRITAIDSIYYYENSIPHVKSKTDYSSDTLYPSSKMVQYFDTTGTINLELEFNIESNGQLIPIKSKSFVYQNGKLTRIIKLYLGTYELWGNKMKKTEEYYYYDKRNLVIKKEWYTDDKPEPYLVYTYEYR